MTDNGILIMIGVMTIINAICIVANLLTVSLNMKLYTEYFKDMSCRNREK